MGKAPTFFLVRCELMPFANMSLEEKKRFHEETCEVRCGIYRDWVKRKTKAEKKGKQYRQLVCVHPQNREAWEKWKPHVTIWGR